MKKVNIPNSSKILYSNIIASLDCLSLIKFNTEVDRMIQIRGNKMMVIKKHSPTELTMNAETIAKNYLNKETAIFYEAVYNLFVSKDDPEELDFYGNKYKLKDLPGFPKEIDLENFDVIGIYSKTIDFSAGGDWQQSLNFSMLMEDGKLIITNIFNSMLKQNAKQIKQRKKLIIAVGLLNKPSEAKDITKSLTFSGWKLQGRTKVQGLDISIENKKGSIRSGTDPNGHKWKIKMNADYGYIRGTVGKDKDHLDCYVGPNKESEKVFIIHQNNPDTGTFDEDKVMLGFNSAEEAKKLYLKQYDRPEFFGSMDETTIEKFKAEVFKNKGKKLVIKLKKEYVDNIEQATEKNTNYRKVLFTGKHTQLVLMSLDPGVEIGEETHENLDQFIRIEEGTGAAILDGKTHKIQAGDAVVIVAGTRHNIKCTGDSSLKLYTLYTSKEHAPGLVEEYKKAMEDNVGLTVELLKGKSYPVGTVRNWKGKNYVKTNDGWKPKTDNKNIVYKDMLGNLDYKGVISRVGDKLYLAKTSNAPEKYWSIKTDPSIIVKEMNDLGWDTHVSKDMQGFPLINVEHIKTKKLYLKKEQEHAKKWKNGKDVFIRFGDIPKSGFSKDWSSGDKEKGVSVFRGKILPSGEILPLPKTNQEMGSLLTMNERPLYVIEGDVAGIGADGEPVLINAKKMTPKEAAVKLFNIKKSKQIKLSVLIKGRKPLPIGTEKIWQGKKFKKTSQGWQLLGSGRGRGRPRKEVIVIKETPEKKQVLINSKNFLNWFGDWKQGQGSKVVKSNGSPQETYNTSPMKVYHGTAVGGFTSFKKENIQSYNIYGGGFYFTEDEEIAKEYSENKDTEESERAAHTQGIFINGKATRYFPESFDLTKYLVSDKEAFYAKNGTLESLFGNPNWSNELKGALSASYEKGKGWNFDTFKETFFRLGKERFEKLRANPGNLFDHGFGYFLKILKEKEPSMEFDIPAGEVFEVYLNIRKPFDMDKVVTEEEFNSLKTALIDNNFSPYLDDLFTSDTIKKITGVEDYAAPLSDWTYEALLKAKQYLKKKVHDRTESNPYYSMVKGQPVFPVFSLSNDNVLTNGDIQFILTNGQRGGEVRTYTEVLKNLGYDGIHHTGGWNIGEKKHSVWITFEPTQIKSTKNTGSFDPNNPDMKKSKKSKMVILEKGRKPLPIGTEKTWQGKEYIKTDKGWIPKSSEKSNSRSLKLIVNKEQKTTDFNKLTFPLKGYLHTESWAGHGRHEITILAETKKSYRVRHEDSALDWKKGREHLVPKHAVEIEKKKEPEIIDEETYLAMHGASKLDIGDAATHRRGQHDSDKSWSKVVNRQSKQDEELLNKREELRKEYQRKIESGELREPTRIERLVRTAQGSEDNESTKAARRILIKQGYDWKTGKKNRK